MKRFFQRSSLLSLTIGLLTCAPALAIDSEPTNANVSPDLAVSEFTVDPATPKPETSEPGTSEAVSELEASAPAPDTISELISESVQPQPHSAIAESAPTTVPESISAESISAESISAESISAESILAQSIPATSVPAATAPSLASPIASTPTAISSVDDLMSQPADSFAGSGTMGQVTSVSQLSDVQPTDWAFQALQSLVERYGCIVGYPDSTYRGNRALTRYEFAAGLNACLDRISEILASTTANLATQEDLETLRRLQEEFSAELSTLRGRVDALEARTSELEANQFSTTTKLEGEVIFGLSSIVSGDTADGEQAPRNPTFGYRVRLNLLTSFTGEDLLTTRLQAGNFQPLSEILGTNEGRLEFDGSTDNELILALLRYAFPIGDDTTVYIAGTGNGFVDLDASTQLTPYLDGTAVSLFGLRNPIYNYSFGTGLGLRQFFFDDRLELNLGYLTPNASIAESGAGLFNGQYGALAQFIVYPTDSITVGFTYINSYTPEAASFGVATGSNAANDDFGRPVSANSYGISGTIDITDGLAFGGWVGYSHHRYIGRGDGEVWTWAGSLSFPDLFGDGNLGGILVGMEPRLTRVDASVPDAEADPDTSLHIEAFYRYRLSDRMDITPGVIWLTAPNHNADNRDVVIGVVRTRLFF
ncbi:iron uptake porin [Leptolyngbya ohadii]|uniref:iron uptake porin n=1 Tax=Leptolyngbya ohadii TaxID=1962290 RepID=UPI000B59DE05|nr:iron uptake porin [Leptolyngbya ohadii]